MQHCHDTCRPLLAPHQEMGSLVPSHALPIVREHQGEAIDYPLEGARIRGSNGQNCNGDATGEEGHKEAPVPRQLAPKQGQEAGREDRGDEKCSLIAHCGLPDDFWVLYTHHPATKVASVMMKCRLQAVQQGESAATKSLKCRGGGQQM